MKFSLTLTLLLLFTTEIFAQFYIDPQYRIRSEFRDGYMTLRPQGDQTPAFFTEQRTRLTFTYASPRFKIQIAPQDVRLWGQTKTTTTRSESSFSLFEAWAEAVLKQDTAKNQTLSLRLGRQMLNYDDERLLGGLDWASQGRRHDMALLMYERKKSGLHLGAAFNQAGPPALFGSVYVIQVPDDYKALQFARYHFEVSKFKTGLLVLNEMNQESFPVAPPAIPPKPVNRTRTTLGGITDFVHSKFKATLTGYYQFGQTPTGLQAQSQRKNISAFTLSGLVTYRFLPKWDLSAGYDYLSGNDVNPETAPQTNTFFNPVYGTNHKFYGYMDYFYVGVGHREAGLQDLNFRLKYTPSGKWNAYVDVHRFASAGRLFNTFRERQSSHIGTEVDLIVNVKAGDFCKIQGGYSAMFAGRSMELLKDGNAGKYQHWAYLMITFQPAKPAKITLPKS